MIIFHYMLIIFIVKLMVVWVVVDLIVFTWNVD